jgi:predicted nucleic acid-binding protein
MARTKPKPRVYLDSSCIGRVLDESGEAKDALLALLANIEHKQLVFVNSAWLDSELRETEPKPVRVKLLKAVPKGEWVQWDRALARSALKWATALGLDDDDSGEADCRHLASALRGRADILITHDGRFYEAHAPRC